MLIAQIEGFLATARAGSLRGAADELFVTQPALTARLRALEEELGAELFVRSRRGMALTDAGRGFLPYAERALASLADGRVYVADLARGVTGELAIGAAPAVSTYVLPRLLVRYAQLQPNVRLVVRTGHSEEIVEMVLRGEVAVGLIRELRDPNLEARALYEDELVLVAPADHPFAGAARIGVERIAETRLVMFDRTSSWFEVTSHLFRAAGVAPASVMELDNIDAAKRMVVHGLGVALLPWTAVADEVADGTLVIVRIAGTSPLRRRIVAVRRRDAGQPAGVVAAFLAMLRTIADLVPDRPGTDVDD